MYLTYCLHSVGIKKTWPLLLNRTRLVCEWKGVEGEGGGGGGKRGVEVGTRYLLVQKGAIDVRFPHMKGLATADLLTFARNRESVPFIRHRGPPIIPLKIFFPSSSLYQSNDIYYSIFCGENDNLASANFRRFSHILQRRDRCRREYLSANARPTWDGYFC